MASFSQPNQFDSETRESQQDLKGSRLDAIQSASLSERLDQLLASYLELLDTYTSLRTQLSKDFSSGFFALAQANRSSTLGPGRRYGEEGYDDRMKALRRVKIESGTDSEHVKTVNVASAPQDAQQGEESRARSDTDKVAEDLKIERSADQVRDRDRYNTIPSEEDEDILKNGSTWTKQQSNDDQSTEEQEDPASDSPSNSVQDASHQSSPLTHPTSTLTSRCTMSNCYTYTSTYTSTAIASASSTSTGPPASTDPLKWYGILVPAPLRTSQTHFQTIVASTIPALLTLESRLRSLETEIWAVRRDLGVIHSYEYSDYQRGNEAVRDEEAREVVPHLDETEFKSVKETAKATSAADEGPEDERHRSLPPLSSLSLSSPKLGEQAMSKSSPGKKPSILSSSSTTTGLPSEARSRVLKLG